MWLLNALQGQCTSCGGVIDVMPKPRGKSTFRCRDCNQLFARRSIVGRWTVILASIVVFTCIEWMVTQTWAVAGTRAFDLSMYGFLVVNMMIAMGLDHVLRFRRLADDGLA